MQELEGRGPGVLQVVDEQQDGPAQAQGAHEPCDGVERPAALDVGAGALDEGLLAALQEELTNEKITGLTAVSHPDSIYAGAIGAALWGAFRHDRLAAAAK